MGHKDAMFVVCFFLWERGIIGHNGKRVLNESWHLHGWWLGGTSGGENMSHCMESWPWRMCSKF